MKRVPVLLATLLLALPLTACGSPKSEEATRTTLTVYAAASLKGAFGRIAEGFTSEHSGVSVEFSFAGSSDLVAQIQQGAPADVFASADTKNMDKLVAASLVEQGPKDFASNTLQIVVAPGAPDRVPALTDLPKPGVKLVLCAPEVPCGAASSKVEAAAGLDFKPVSEEQSVTDVLNKVIAGEADAGLVYVTDVKGAGDKVTGVTFPESAQAVNTYPIATVKGSDNAEVASQFMDYVLSAAGRDVLAEHGFAQP